MSLLIAIIVTVSICLLIHFIVNVIINKSNVIINKSYNKKCELEHIINDIIEIKNYLHDMDLRLKNIDDFIHVYGEVSDNQFEKTRELIESINEENKHTDIIKIRRNKRNKNIDN